MTKVAFLFDKSNNWISSYFSSYLNKNARYNFYKFYDPDKVRNFDIVFVLGFTKILRGKILSSNKHMLLVHESDLPQGKGFAPLQWQILEGSNNVIISLILIDEKVDCGDIVEQQQLVFSGNELYDEIRLKQAMKTYELINSFLEKYPNFIASKQTGKSSFYKKRTPKDSELDLDKTIREQFQLLRICNNDEWPAFFIMNGKKYIIKIYEEGKVKHEL